MNIRFKETCVESWYSVPTSIVDKYGVLEDRTDRTFIKSNVLVETTGRKELLRMHVTVSWSTFCERIDFTSPSLSYISNVCQRYTTGGEIFGVSVGCYIIFLWYEIKDKSIYHWRLNGLPAEIAKATIAFKKANVAPTNAIPTVTGRNVEEVWKYFTFVLAKLNWRIY